MKDPAWTLESGLVVEKIDEDGDLHFAWEITRCALCDPGESEQALVEDMLTLKGFTVRGRANAQGIVHAVAFEENEELGYSMRNMFESLQIVLNDFATPLPAEPVGVGARWAVARSTTQMGMRMVETSEYELVGIEDGGFTLRVRTALTAPEQTVAFSGAPSGLDMTLTSFHGRGMGDVRLDLTHLVPRALSSRVEGKFEAESDLPESSGTLTGTFRFEVEMVRE